MLRRNRLVTFLAFFVFHVPPKSFLARKLTRRKFTRGIVAKRAGQGLENRRSLCLYGWPRILSY